MNSYPRFRRVVRLNAKLVRASHMGRDRQRDLIAFITKTAQLSRELAGKV